jgi:hypothetical protein
MPAVLADRRRRLARLEQAIAALEETRRAQEDAPAALREALAGFRAERDALRRAEGLPPAA